MARELTTCIINYIPDGVSEDQLATLFEPYGPVHVKLVTNKMTGLSMGYGFLEFTARAAADACIAAMNGLPLYGKRLKVTLAKPREEVRYNTNVYVAGVPPTWTGEMFRHMVAQLGEIMEHRLMPAQSGHTTLSGFARFARRAESDTAIAVLDGFPVAPEGLLIPCDMHDPHLNARKMDVAALPGVFVLSAKYAADARTRQKETAGAWAGQMPMHGGPYAMMPSHRPGPPPHGGGGGEYGPHTSYSPHMPPGHGSYPSSMYSPPPGGPPFHHPGTTSGSGSGVMMEQGWSPRYHRDGSSGSGGMGSGAGMPRYMSSDSVGGGGALPLRYGSGEGPGMPPLPPGSSPLGHAGMMHLANTMAPAMPYGAAPPLHAHPGSYAPPHPWHSVDTANMGPGSGRPSRMSVMSASTMASTAADGSMPSRVGGRDAAHGQAPPARRDGAFHPYVTFGLARDGTPTLPGGGGYGGRGTTPSPLSPLPLTYPYHYPGNTTSTSGLSSASSRGMGVYETSAEDAIADHMASMSLAGPGSHGFGEGGGLEGDRGAVPPSTSPLKPSPTSSPVPALAAYPPFSGGGGGGSGGGGSLGGPMTRATLTASLGGGGVGSLMSVDPPYHDPPHNPMLPPQRLGAGTNSIAEDGSTTGAPGGGLNGGGGGTARRDTTATTRISSARSVYDSTGGSSGGSVLDTSRSGSGGAGSGMVGFVGFAPSGPWDMASNPVATSRPIYACSTTTTTTSQQASYSAAFASMPLPAPMSVALTPREGTDLALASSPAGSSGEVLHSGIKRPSEAGTQYYPTVTSTSS